MLCRHPKTGARKEQKVEEGLFFRIAGRRCRFGQIERRPVSLVWPVENLEILDPPVRLIPIGRDAGEGPMVLGLGRSKNHWCTLEFAACGEEWRTLPDFGDAYLRPGHQHEVAGYRCKRALEVKGCWGEGLERHYEGRRCRCVGKVLKEGGSEDNWETLGLRRNRSGGLVGMKGSLARLERGRIHS